MKAPVKGLAITAIPLIAIGAALLAFGPSALSRPEMGMARTSEVVPPSWLALSS